MLERWLAHPARIAAILLAAAAVAAFLVARARLGPGAAGDGACTVVVEHFGIDAAEMERSITVPLEDALASVAGVREIRSVSELGRSRVTVWLAAGGRGAPAAVRDAVARVSAGLPASAQRPRITSGAPSERPVFVAALRAAGMTEEELARLARSELEPAFARVRGAGEIEIGGGAVREVHVRVDQRRASALGLGLRDVAEALGEQCLLVPTGTLEVAGRELPVAVYARPGSLRELAALRVRLPGRAGQGGPASVALAEIAEVAWGIRERETISRVDGTPLVVLYVQSAGSADPIALSAGLRAEAARWAGRGLEIQVLYDAGAELRQAVASVASAGLESLAAVTLLLPLLIRGLRRLVVLWTSLPLAVAFAAAALSALGVTLDRDVLAGLAVGVGTIVDTGVITGAQRDSRELAALVPALAASLATTLIVLVPLAFLEFASRGIRSMALAMGLLLAASFAISVLFLPAFSLGGNRAGAAPPDRPFRRLPWASRRVRRMLPAVVTVSMRRRRLVLAGSAALVAASVAVLVPMGIDFAAEPEADSVVAHVELEPEATVDSSDERIAAFAASLSRSDGITMVESIARRGNGDLRIGFDPARRSASSALALVRTLGARIPGGFVYLPEGSAPGERPIEVAILGDDHATLRALARGAAAALSGASMDDVVLQFKEPAPVLAVGATGDASSSRGVSAAEVAGALRWAVYGPVALKWIDSQREVDLRVMAAVPPVPRTLPSLPVVDSAGGVHDLASLAQIVSRSEGSRRYRKDRRPAVFLTVSARARSLDRAVAGVRAALARVPLPRGYTFEIDRSVATLEGNLRTLWLVLGLSAGLVWMTLAAFSESLLAPLVVLSILPTSLAVPLLAGFAAGMPLRAATLVALVVVSGMVVNNSILVFDGVRAGSGAGLERAVVQAVRRRARPLLVTTGATVIGVLPLLRAGGREGLLGSLAFVMLWGMLGSFASTIIVLPAVLAVMPGAARSARPS